MVYCNKIVCNRIVVLVLLIAGIACAACGNEKSNDNTQDSADNTEATENDGGDSDSTAASTEADEDSDSDTLAPDAFDIGDVKSVTQSEFFEIVCNKAAKCDPERYAAMLSQPYANGSCYLELHDELGPDFCFGFQEEAAADCLRTSYLHQLTDYTCLDPRPINPPMPEKCTQQLICETWEDD